MPHGWRPRRRAVPCRPPVLLAHHSTPALQRARLASSSGATPHLPAYFSVSLPPLRVLPPSPSCFCSVQGYGPKAEGYPSYVYPGSGATCDTKELADAKQAQEAAAAAASAAAVARTAADAAAASAGGEQQGGTAPAAGGEAMEVDGGGVGEAERSQAGAQPPSSAAQQQQANGTASAGQDAAAIEEDPDGEFGYTGTARGWPCSISCAASPAAPAHAAGAAAKAAAAAAAAGRKHLRMPGDTPPQPVPCLFGCLATAANPPSTPLRAPLPCSAVLCRPPRHPCVRALLRSAVPRRRAGASPGGPSCDRHRHPRLWAQARAVAPLLARQNLAGLGQVPARHNLHLRGWVGVWVGWVGWVVGDGETRSWRGDRSRARRAGAAGARRQERRPRPRPALAVVHGGCRRCSCRCDAPSHATTAFLPMPQALTPTGKTKSTFGTSASQVRRGDNLGRGSGSAVVGRALVVPTASSGLW